MPIVKNTFSDVFEWNYDLKQQTYGVKSKPALNPLVLPHWQIENYQNSYIQGLKYRNINLDKFKILRENVSKSMPI
jgi:hypothetical protein